MFTLYGHSMGLEAKHSLVVSYILMTLFGFLTPAMTAMYAHFAMFLFYLKHDKTVELYRLHLTAPDAQLCTRSTCSSWQCS